MDRREEFPLEDIGLELLDECFPKGECKERGRAIVLYTRLLVEFKSWLDEHYTQKEEK